ncbi:MAG: exosortase/archaeosortase family protein [Candidatus Bathyarchaeia archaeon]
MLRKFFPHPTESQITLGVKIAAIAITTIALFSQDLTIIFTDAFQNELTSHLLAIPIVFAYLIYRKRKMLRAVIPIENKNEPKEIRHIPLICGALLSITAILLYWYGSYTFTPIEYHMLALPIFAAGLTLTLFNPQTLIQLAFPVAFLIFLMPPPSEILYAIGSVLSVISAECANAIVNAFSIPSSISTEYANPKITVLRSDGTTFEPVVDIACSGIYSLIGFLIFALFIAYIMRDKMWKKIAIILVGIPLIYSLNIMRITIMLLLGYYYGEELALQIFHLTGGWMLLFLGTILLLAISEKLFKTRIFASAQTKCPECSSKTKKPQTFCARCGKVLTSPNIRMSKIDIAKIATIAITVTLLISIQAPVFALTKTKPIIVTTTSTGQKQLSAEILPTITNYTLIDLPSNIEFAEKAKQDMALWYIYIPEDDATYSVEVTIEIASARSSLHRWETCLITWPISRGYQPKVTQMELKDVKLNENPPIIGRYFVFTYTETNETKAVLYWYETTIFTINQTAQQKHVKLSLIVDVTYLEDLPEIEDQLISIAKVIVTYWQPIKTWSQMTLVISQNGATLAGISSIALMAVIAVYVLKNEMQKQANTNAYYKLSKINQKTVDVLKETEKKKRQTLNNIALTYKEITGKQITKKQLLKRLEEIEKIRVIKNTIANENDEPIQIWKTKIK